MNTLLVDGNWYLHRAYHVSPDKKHGVTSLFISLVCKDALATRSDKLLIAFDGDSIFRYELYPEYKANRKNKVETNKKKSNYGELKTSDEVYQVSLPFLLEKLNELGFPWVQNPEVEADDILCSTSKGKGQFILAAKDKDQYQSLSSHCKMYVSDADPPKYITAEDVKVITGLPPDKQVMYQMIMGDGIDNIIGIPGYGKKRAQQIAKSYHSIREWYDNSEEKEQQLLMQHKLRLRINKKLVELRTDVPGTPRKLGKVSWNQAPKSMVQYLEFLYPKTRGLFSRGR